MNAPAPVICGVTIATLFLGAVSQLPATPPEQLLPEEDSLLVQETQTRRAPRTPLLFANLPDSQPASSGSWYLSIGMGAGFPYYSSGEVVNNAAGAAEPLRANTSFAFTSLLSTGYRWFDPQRWGRWSFDVDFVGAYLGTGVSTLQGRNAINLGFLGLRGRVGYRVLHDRFEPFIGFAAGGVIYNVETAGLDHGDVWGYWFAPSCGIRYYIPRTRWSVTVEGLFRFVGGVNGLDGGPGRTIDLTPDASLNGHWIYVPLGVMAIGYRF